MSLSRNGIWKAGVWGTSVWANGVWYEPAATSAGPRPRRRNIEEEIHRDDDEVMAMLHASLPELIRKHWK